MLVNNYKKRIFRPEMNPQFQSLHCIATLDADISAALPFLNTVLGAANISADPPEALFRVHGRLIKVGAREIALNALKSEEEADKVLGWLLREINQAWENRKNIDPSYEAVKPPKVFEVLRRLPKTNCGKCGLPTCMVFSVRACEGVLNAEDCPDLSKEARQDLAAYLEPFFRNNDFC